MKIKTILKYFFALSTIGLLVFAYLAKQDFIKIYGGHTQKVDYRQFDLPSNSYTLTNVNVLAPDGNSFLTHQTVHIDQGLIVSVDSLSDNLISDKTVDGSDKFLIPGLIDAHVHLFKSPNDLLLYPANGVTQIRELIGEKDHLAWRKQIEEEGRLGPQMYIASPRVGSFGAVEGFFMELTQGFKSINTKEEAEAYVLELKANGYDAVKIYSHINKESYKAINTAAVAAGLDVLGHIPWSVELEDVWNSEQSDIAHLEEIMNALRREFEREERAEEYLTFINRRSQEIVEDLTSNDISVTTTLWLVESFLQQKCDLKKILSETELAYENPGISEWSELIPHGLGWLPAVNRYKFDADKTAEEIEGEKEFWRSYSKACQIILKNLSAGGVKIMAGTDANLPPTVPGFSLHDELESMHRAGMSNADVLRSATTIPANWLNIKAGKIVPGYRADMVLLDKNPLENIENTKTINTVIVNGKILERNTLDSILAAVKSANDASRTVDISEFTKEEYTEVSLGKR